jgi:hypothetical protein
VTRHGANLQAMTLGRLIRTVLLLALPLAAGLAGSASGRSDARQRVIPAATFSIGAPRESLPTPVHDEATCAFCQAAIFPPHVGAAGPGIPDVPVAVHREVLSFEERIPHSSADRPASSRAPPILRCA